MPKISALRHRTASSACLPRRSASHGGSSELRRGVKSGRGREHGKAAQARGLDQHESHVTVRAGEIFGREPVAVTSLPRCGVPRRGPRPFPGSFRVGACQLCRVHHGPGNARVRRRLVNPNVAPQFPNGASWWGPTHRLRLASFKRQSHSCWTRFCYHRPLTLRRIPPLNSFHSQWFTSDASCFAHKAVTHLTPQGFHHNG